MKGPKHIEPPKFDKARKLTMLELNKFKTSVTHTVITPELLAEMADAKK